MNVPRFSLLVVFLLTALCSRAEFVLKGITIVRDEPLFSIYSVEEKTSKWVSLGQTFAGYKVLAFDPHAGVVTLGKGDFRQRVRLQGSTIKDSSAEDAKARLRSLKGIDLAYELAKQGDVEIGELLRAYQTIVARLREASALTEHQTPQVNSALKFLTAQREELHAQLEKASAAKAVLLLAPRAEP